MTTRQRNPDIPAWQLDAIRDLENRLNAFRSTCRVTTLTEVQTSRRSPFHLLVSCVISLRTKDEVTHDASRRLYRLADSPAELAELSEEEIAKAIYPAGFYNTKAGQLRRIAAILVADHGGDVPDGRGGAARAARRRSQDRQSGPRTRVRDPGDLRRHPRPPDLESARAGGDENSGRHREGAPRRSFRRIFGSISTICW